MARDGRGVKGAAAGRIHQSSGVENEHLPRRLLRDGAQSLADAELVSCLSCCIPAAAAPRPKDWPRSCSETSADWQDSAPPMCGCWSVEESGLSVQ